MPTRRDSSIKAGITAGTRARSAPDRLALDGDVWFMVGTENLGGLARMRLLSAIAERGSITQAAKAVGMSYKAAWDTVDAMNKLAGEPLLERTSGGRGGGSTQLTERGKRLVERFQELDDVHRRFIRLLNEEGVDLKVDLNILRTLNMKTSARNQFLGKVTAVRAGAVNDEVELTLDGGLRIVATVTRSSTESLGLRINMTAFALVKASSVIIATELDGARLSARNQLSGTVASVVPGAVNSEVVIDVGGGVSIAAIVSRASASSLGLLPGVAATAIFKASSVIVGVTA